MSFNIERGFISKLLQTKDFASVKDSQIKESYLTGENKNAYNYIADIFTTTGEVPTERVFQRKFPSYSLDKVENDDGESVVGTEENLKFWCEEVRKKARHNQIAQSVEGVASQLQKFDTEEAYLKIKTLISTIEGEYTETADVDITQGIEDRILAYKERKINRGMRGLATGFAHLDNIIKGLEDSTLTTLIAQTGIGKALTVSTPVLTIDGFVPMKDIKVGSKVCSSNGKFYKVSAVYPQGKLPVCRVNFEDGTYVDCCKDHLWKFKTIDDVVRKNDWRVRTLEQILEDHPILRGRSYNICIPVSSPVQFSGNHLPIDPYVLGCLLGDGGFTTDRISFSSTNPDHVEYLNYLLSEWGEFTSTTDKNYTYNFKSWNPGENKLYRAIKSLGLIGCKSGTKFIPDIYLNSSPEDRLALVQGLIDTDGSINPKGAVNYYTGSHKLKDAFVYLIRSLGKRCYTHQYTRGTKNLPEFKVTVSAKDESLYRSVHRAKQWGKRSVPKRINYYGHLKVVSIEILDHEEEMQCITIDSPDHTFICGDFIVTHNTWFEVILGSYCMLNNCRVLQFVTEMSEDIMRDRYEAILFSKCCGNISYPQFKSGQLDSVTEAMYFDFLRDDVPNLEPLYIITATSPLGVSASIDKYKPDIVLIDGAYLMEDDQGAKDDWLRVAHITRDLKKLAKSRKLPIFINTQATKETSKKTGPELESIMYTQAIGQDCMPKDTMILTDKGYVAIQRLSNRTFTLFNGESYKKANCVYAGEKDTTVITHRSGEFVCSPEHKIKVYDNEEKTYVWKQAKDIKQETDFLLEGTFTVENGHKHIIKVNPSKGRKQIKIPSEASFDLGMLIGVFIGDGSIKPIHKGQVTVSCGQDKDYADLCIKLVDKFFGLKGLPKTIKSSTSGKEQILASWYSVKLSEWLRFFINDEGNNKTVKLDFAEMNSEFRAGVIAGLIQSDGCCKKQLSLCSKDHSVIKGANMLFKSFGVRTAYDFQRNSHKGKHRLRISCNEIGKLLFLQTSLTKNKSEDFNKLLQNKYSGRVNNPSNFVKEICSNFKINPDTEVNLMKSVNLGKKTGKLGYKYLDQILKSPYRFIEVLDVTTVSIKQPMWDIEVFSSDKRIIANGIVVHNSDVVLALFRDEIMFNDKEMGIKVLKQREGTLGKSIVNWDFDTMDFSEIYQEREEDKKLLENTISLDD